MTSVGVRQHTQDVSVCPSAQTGRPCVSVSTHRMFVCVRQHTQDIRGCPCVSVSTDRTSVAVHQHTYQHYTHDVRGCRPTNTGCPCVSVFVRVCPSPHTGRPWLSVSTHRMSVAVRVCLCVFVSTHMTSVAVHQYTYQHVGPWTQHAYPSRGLLGLCPSAHTERPWLSISTHISTLVLGLSTLAIPVVCSGDFGLHGLSVQYTQDVRGCPPAHTGRSWLSVSTHRTSVAVRVCPCVSVSTHRTSVDVHQYTYQHDGPWTQQAGPSCGRPCVSVSTHRTSVCVRQHTQDVRGCPCVSVSTHRTYVAVHQYTYQHAGPWTQHAGPSRGWTSVCVRQHTQDIRVCPSAHTGRPCVSHTQDVRVCPSAHTGRPCVSVSTHRTSVCVRQHTEDVRGCPCVSISTHRTFVAVHQYTYQHLGLGLSMLTLPVDCSGYFGPLGLSVQYTHDVRGCPPTHTGCLWLSVSTHRTSVTVRVCPSAHTRRQWLSNIHTGRPCVSVSTHRTSVAVRVCPSAYTGSPWQSISTSTLGLALSTLTLPVDCSGDFGPLGLSVQYTHDARGTSVAIRVCPCVSVSTHRTSVAVHQYTYQHVGPWTQHAAPSRGLFGTSMAVRVCPSVSVSTHKTSVAVHHTHRTSVGVRQHTQDVRGCPSVHISARWSMTQHAGPSHGLFGMSVAVCGCPSAHTGRLWLSISSSTLGFGLSTLTRPVDCSGDFGPLGLFVQYTQDVWGCPPAHTGCPWLSVFVRVCPSAHTGSPWLSISTHISTLVLGLSTLTLPVDCSGDFGPRGLSVQYTQDVCGCPPAYTGRPWLSVCVRVCPSARTGRPTHRMSVGVRQHTQDVRGCLCSTSTLGFGLSTLTLPVDCSGDFGPRGLSVQYTQDVRGCPPAYTGRPWLSVCVRLCPSAHTGCPWLTHRTSVGVRQHTHYVCGCPCVSVFVSLCPSEHTERTWLSISTHISTLVLGLSTLAIPVVCSSDFGPCGLSVQYIQDVRGCPPAHTGRSWLSVSTHRTSVAVRVCPSANTGHKWLSISTHISTLVLGLSKLALPMDGLGDFGPRGLSVHYTQDICGCPSAHTGHLWQSISTHISTLGLGLNMLTLPVDCSGYFGPLGLSVQYTHDVRGCPPTHTGCPWLSVSTRRTSVAVRVCPSAHTGRQWLTHRTSVAVRQHTQNVRGYPSVHISARCTLTTHISMLVLPMDCSCTGFGQLIHHVSTNMSTLALSVNCSCTDLDMSSSFDGLDFPSQAD
ncbi:hypothetical protein YC2023_108629 [Brassica napus]